jgi:hypothetical protein
MAGHVTMTHGRPCELCRTAAELRGSQKGGREQLLPQHQQLLPEPTAAAAFNDTLRSLARFPPVTRQT